MGNSEWDVLKKHLLRKPPRLVLANGEERRGHSLCSLRRKARAYRFAIKNSAVKMRINKYSNELGYGDIA